MSDSSNNGCPPPPSGVEGKDTQRAARTDIVPYGSKPEDKRPSLFQGKGFSLWMGALGGIVASTSAPVLSPVLVACSFASALKHGRRQAIVVAAVTLACAVGFSVPSGVAPAANALIACSSALVAAGLLAKQKMTPGLGCVIVAGFALVQLGVDAGLAALQGTSLLAVVTAALDMLQQEFAEASPSVSLQFQAIRPLFSTMWPTTYLVVSLGEYLFARLGAWFSFDHSDEELKGWPQFADYDLPLWVVAALVLTAAGVAVVRTVPGLLGGVPEMVIVNLIMALRFAFAAQGLAVTAWLLRAKHVRRVATGLLGVLALYLEAQFFVLTIVGIVDVWINFRHLQRGSEARKDANTTAKQQ